MKTIIFTVLLCIVLFAGCTQNLANFGLLSTKQLDIRNKDVQLIAHNIEGRDEFHIIIFIPTGQLSIDDAVRDALNRYNADFLTNVKIDQFFFYIPYIYGRGAIIVRGDAYRLKESTTYEFGLLPDIDEETYKVLVLEDLKYEGE